MVTGKKNGLDPSGVKNKKMGPHPARSQNPWTGILFFLIPGPRKKMKVLKKIRWIRPPPHPGQIVGGYPHPFFFGDLPNLTLVH